LVVIALEARQQPYSLEHTMHTNSKTAFARGDRLTPEDLSLGEEAQTSGSPSQVTSSCDRLIERRSGTPRIGCVERTIAPIRSS
jgi:hypothetical protein